MEVVNHKQRFRARATSITIHKQLIYTQTIFIKRKFLFFEHIFYGISMIISICGYVGKKSWDNKNMLWLWTKKICFTHFYFSFLFCMFHQLHFAKSIIVIWQFLWKLYKTSSYPFWELLHYSLLYHSQYMLHHNNISKSCIHWHWDRIVWGD